MALTLNVREADPASEDDMIFFVRMAALSGLGWDIDSAIRYATNPNVLLDLVEGTWPERGFTETTRILAWCGVWPTNGGREIRAMLLAIDPEVLDDADVSLQTVRHRVIDEHGRQYLRAVQQRLGSGAKVLIGPIPTGGTFARLMGYLDTVPQDSAVVGADGRKSLTLDVDALLTTFDARA